MNYILSILLGLSQIVIFPNLSFRWAKEITLQILILSLLGCSIWKKNKWITLFIAWSLVLFFAKKSFIINDVSDIPTYTINMLALMNIMNIVLIGVFYYILHNIKIDTKLIYKTICFIAIFHSVYVILQKCQLDQFFYSISLHSTVGSPKVCWPVSTWANESICSWCIALCSPFLLAYKELRFKIGYVVCFIAIILTQVTSGIIGFVLGFLFWLWHKNKKITIILTVIILLTGGVLIHSGKFDYYLQDTHRIKVWTKAVQIWKERPTTGWGVGSFRAIFWERAPEFRTDGHWAQAHNEYLQVLFETGIIGLGIVFGLIFTTALSFFRNRRGVIPLTCLIVSAFISIFSFPFHTAQGVIIILALVLYEKERDNFETT